MIFRAICLYGKEMQSYPQVGQVGQEKNAKDKPIFVPPKGGGTGGTRIGGTFLSFALCAYGISIYAIFNRGGTKIVFCPGARQSTVGHNMPLYLYRGIVVPPTERK